MILILRSLVSDFFADSIQHIHSLRASGVIRSHTESTAGAEINIFRRSAGTSCTTPVAIFFVIESLYQKNRPRERVIAKRGPFYYNSLLGDCFLPEFLSFSFIDLCTQHHKFRIERSVNSVNIFSLDSSFASIAEKTHNDWINCPRSLNLSISLYTRLIEFACFR